MGPGAAEGHGSAGETPQGGAGDGAASHRQARRRGERGGKGQGSVAESTGGREEGEGKAPRRQTPDGAFTAGSAKVRDREREEAARGTATPAQEYGDITFGCTENPRLLVG